MELLGSSNEVSFVTSLNDRLVIRAAPAIHRRVEKMVTKELAGLMFAESPTAPGGMGGLVAPATFSGATTPIPAVSPTFPAANTPPVLPPSHNE